MFAKEIYIRRRSALCGKMGSGLILIPGYVFYPFKNGGRNYVRSNYSYESDERLLAGMEVFRAALLESLEG